MDMVRTVKTLSTRTSDMMQIDAVSRVDAPSSSAFDSIVRDSDAKKTAIIPAIDHARTQAGRQADRQAGRQAEAGREAGRQAGRQARRSVDRLVSID